MSETDSSSRSRRQPGVGPNSMPNASCSRSNHAPPIPRIARPSLMWSSVMASFAVRPGLRKVLAPTIRPSVACFVTLAQAARVVQPSRFGPSHGPTMAIRWSQVQSESNPFVSARMTASRSVGHESVCGQSWAPILTLAATSVAAEVVVDLLDAQEERDPRLRAERRERLLGGVAVLVAIGEVADVLAGAADVVDDLVDPGGQPEPGVAVLDIDDRDGDPAVPLEVGGPAAAGAGVDEEPVVVEEVVPGDSLARRAVGIDRRERREPRHAEEGSVGVRQGSGRGHGRAWYPPP